MGRFEFKGWDGSFVFLTSASNRIVTLSSLYAADNVSNVAQWTIDDLLVESNGRPSENPVPFDAAPRPEAAAGHGGKDIGPSKSSDMMAFDIRSTSQAAAQAALEKVEAGSM